MAATERVVVLMTHKQKSEVTRRAAAKKMSVGNFMLQQALGEDEILGALVHEWAASTEKARITLDRTLARSDESESRMPEIEAAARERAKSEFAALDPELFAQLLQ